MHQILSYISSNNILNFYVIYNISVHFYIKKLYQEINHYVQYRKSKFFNI